MAETTNQKPEARSQKSEAAPAVVPAVEGNRAVDSRLRGNEGEKGGNEGEKGGNEGEKGGNESEERGNDQGSEAASAEERLMAFIRRRWDAAIRAACGGTSLVPEFLAALIANESGGRADACRYEPIVYGALVKVQQGRKPRFGGFIREQLADKTPGELRALATSWGLTQIMGYNAAAKGVRVGFTGEEARAPETNLALAAEMLTDFARRFHLDPARDFPALLHTWNTGSPDGRTFDPEYVPRALQRMEIYRQLAESSRQKAEGSRQEAEESGA